MPRMQTVLAAVLVAAASLPRPTTAQTFPTDDPVLRQIWAEGMERSRAQPLMQALADSIGPRLTGTPGIKAGNDWLVATYTRWGIPARNVQYGTWLGWKRGVTHVDLLTPRVRTLEGTMLAWSGGTKGKAVTGPTVILPNVADSAAFAAWLPQAKGRFVLISRLEPTCRPDSTWQRFALPPTFERMTRERDSTRQAWQQRLQRTGRTGPTLPVALEQAGALGVITSTWPAGYGVTRIFQARTREIPSVDLSCEDYGLVFRLTENRQGATLRIFAEAEFQGDVPVFNTIAEIKGTEKPDEYVMFSAHFDSWDGSSGATDNATGTITMLEAMRILKAAYPAPKRTILVGHWSGEEQGLNGSRAFAADHPKIVEGLQALFNQDNGTGRVANVSASGLINAGAHLASWFSRLPLEFTRNITLGFPGNPPGGGSDHASFACYGAPGIGLSSLGWEYSPYTWHTNRDTYDKVVFDELRMNATLAAMLAYLAAEDPVKVPRERRVMRPGPGNQSGTWPACQQPARSMARPGQ